jgi:hypothetical protein
MQNMNTTYLTRNTTTTTTFRTIISIFLKIVVVVCIASPLNETGVSNHLVLRPYATGALITFPVVPNQASFLPALPALPRYPADQDRPFELLELDPFIGFDAAQNVHVTRAASYVANARAHVILLVLLFGICMMTRLVTNVATAGGRAPAPKWVPPAISFVWQQHSFYVRKEKSAIVDVEDFVPLPFYSLGEGMFQLVPATNSDCGFEWIALRQASTTNDCYCLEPEAPDYRRRGMFRLKERSRYELEQKTFNIGNERLSLKPSPFLPSVNEESTSNFNAETSGEVSIPKSTAIITQRMVDAMQWEKNFLKAQDEAYRQTMARALQLRAPRKAPNATMRTLPEPRRLVFDDAPFASRKIAKASSYSTAADDTSAFLTNIEDEEKEEEHIEAASAPPPYSVIDPAPPTVDLDELLGSGYEQCASTRLVVRFSRRQRKAKKN